MFPVEFSIPFFPPTMSLPVAPLAHPTDLSHDRTVHSHVRFFDGGKGVIYPLDTLRGFLALGFNIIVSVFAMFVYVPLRGSEGRSNGRRRIHGGFSYWTRKSWIPDPLFRLEIPLMHRAKHGSDTGTYTTSVRTLHPSLGDRELTWADVAGRI